MYLCETEVSLYITEELDYNGVISCTKLAHFENSRAGLSQRRPCPPADRKNGSEGQRLALEGEGIGWVGIV